MKSVIQDKKECFVCKNTIGLECHHIFMGYNRKHADEDGLTVWLCHQHHNEPPDGVHFNRELRDELQRIAQRVYEIDHTRSEFMERYGKNYL